MSSIPRCQSKNRKPGGCGDPRCPENIYLQNAINTAIDNGDIESFLTARELFPITIKRDSNGITDTLTVSEKQDASRKILGKTFKTKKIVSKEITVPSAIAASLVDKTDQPVFPSMKAVTGYAKTLYGDAIMNLNVLDNYPVEGFVSLANIVVAPDSRGYGVGKHIIGMLNKSADLTGRVISLSPAVSDDGQLQRPDRDRPPGSEGDRRLLVATGGRPALGVPA